MDTIKNYYERFDEDKRLLSRDGQVEYITTMKYIHECLNDKPDAKIIEIGAGTGRYSVSLAKEGYDVTAIDLVPANLEKLKEKLDGTEKIEVREANAMDLSHYKDDTFDVTLLLGPMYHLFSATDMKRALSEAVRVTKKGGYIFVAYIMNEPTIIEALFIGGRYDAINEKGLISDDWHALSTPDELFAMVRTEEIDALNSTVPAARYKLIASDGTTALIKPTIDGLDDEHFEKWIDYHLNICERPDIVGMSNHSLDILRKND